MRGRWLALLTRTRRKNRRLRTPCGSAATAETEKKRKQKKVHAHEIRMLRETAGAAGAEEEAAVSSMYKLDIASGRRVYSFRARM